MGHHEVDLGLRELIEGRALREKQSDELMVSLYGTLLVRSAGVTIKDARAQRTIFALLNGGWVAELAAVVVSRTGDMHENISSPRPVQNKRSLSCIQAAVRF